MNRNEARPAPGELIVEQSFRLAYVRFLRKVALAARSRQREIVELGAPEVAWNFGQFAKACEEGARQTLESLRREGIPEQTIQDVLAHAFGAGTGV